MEWQGIKNEEDGKPLCAWTAITDEAAKYDKFIVTVEKWDEDREISRQQMKYLHAVVFPTFAKEMFCSLLWAEITLKRSCGEQWLIKRYDKTEIILSKTILTVKQCNQWIENIWDWTSSKNIHIPQPDKDWRKEVKGTT